MNTENHLQRRPGYGAGFTLIEMMIVVVIIAVLAAIAYPSYQNQVQKTRRAEAKTALSTVAQALERCYTRFSGYDNAACATAGDYDAGGFTYSGESPSATNSWYQITAAIDNQSYTLTATPIRAQTSDTKCGWFSLTHTGQRDTEFGTNEECW